MQLHNRTFLYFFLAIGFITQPLKADKIFAVKLANNQKKAAKAKAEGRKEDKHRYKAKAEDYSRKLEAINTLTRAVRSRQRQQASLGKQQVQARPPTRAYLPPRPKSPRHQPAPSDLDDDIPLLLPDSQDQSPKRKPSRATRIAAGVGAGAGLAALGGVGFLMNQQFNSSATTASQNADNKDIDAAQSAALAAQTTSAATAAGLVAKANTADISASLALKADESTRKANIENINRALDAKANASDIATLAGKIGAIAEGTSLVDVVATKADQSALATTNTKIETLTGTINNPETGLGAKANTSDVYTKPQADLRFAPQQSIVPPPTTSTPAASPLRGKRNG